MIDASARTITTTRLLDAPQAVVWEAWTDPEQLALWWGPNGFNNTVKKFEPRLGGRFDLTMHGPDGTDYRNESHFSEFVPKSRLAYVHETAPKFVATVTFEAQGEKTLLTLHSKFDTAQGYESAIETFGAVEGAKQTIGRLADHLALPPAKKVVVLSRMLPAPQAQVWKALTTPEGMMQWFSPKGVTTPEATSDLRVGGRWSVIHRGSDGVDHLNVGKYLEVSPEHRLAFSWVMESAPGTIVVEAHQYFILIPNGGKTRLTFVARVITAGPGSEYFMSGVDQGWSEALDKLAQAL